MPDTDIHIALTFDDNFWAPAFATMRSVCLATHRKTDLNFHLCHLPLTDEHRADLEKIATEFGAHLHWYDISKLEQFTDIAARARYNRRLSNIVYARLLFDRFLPSEITRLIYLDCDLYVRAGIEELADLDLQGFSLAAVRDHLSPLITSGRDLRHNRDLFDLADPYFNAGMLVIDMAKWGEADVPSRLEAAIADGTMDRIYYDQDFLNLTFRNNWLQLGPLWNVIDARPAHEGLNPHILHYTGHRKPWHLISGVAFARTYRHVMTNELFYRFARHRVKRQARRLLRLTSP